MSTRTYAVMQVSQETYTEIENRLRAAGYDHAIHPDTDHGQVLDMHGIAVGKLEHDDMLVPPRQFVRLPESQKPARDFTNEPDYKFHTDEDGNANIQLRLIRIKNGWLIKAGKQPFYCKDEDALRSALSIVIDDFTMRLRPDPVENG